MAPVIEKRAIQQQQQQKQQGQGQGHNLSSSSILKEGTVGLTNVVTSQSSVQNALNHSSHGHGHGQHGQQHHPHHHHNYHHNHHFQHAKENTLKQSFSGNSKKGLEILDFHESWREEMESYKDSMYVKKHIPTHLLGSHNHAHTVEGCQLDKSNNVGANKFTHVTKQHNNSINSNSSNSYSDYATHGNVSNIITTSSATGHTIGAKRNENKIRVRVAPTLSAPSGGDLSIKKDKNNGGNNQRPREEMPPKTASGSKYSDHCGAKRSSHSSAQASSNNGDARHLSPTKCVTGTAYSTNSYENNNAHNSSSFSTNANSTHSPTKNNMKIIVNQFHASSLLNGQHFEGKEQILTQNGLTNPNAATAYEASFYAANYLTPDAHNNSNLYNNQMHANDGGHEHADDDPCTAIDDISTYTDSDSDDEPYTGQPFYLKEDGDETHQSKNIRYEARLKGGKEENVEDSPKNNYYTPECILSPSLFPNVPPYLNFSSHAQSGPPMPPQLRKVLKWKLSPVMPKIVRRVVLNSGFRIIKNTTDWMAVWEKHMKSPGFRTIRSHQKYNHMPGSFRIGRKDSMWRNIHTFIQKFGNKEFGFMQKSYVIPDDLESLRKVWPKHASRCTKWIVKPPASARGTGISIVNKWSQFPKDRPLVVQKYIERPLLVNDNKFDLRIYVVMTSINPLRLYIYKDGLARFASVKYNSELNNLDIRCMHLTNYSINKFSQNYTKNEDVNACQGHKWTLQSLWSCLEQRGVNTKRLWATLRNLVIKAIISGESGLNRTYRQNVNFRYNCFELFGFDVLLDENLVPWLLEINISPSLHSELPLDLHVKGPLIQAILNTAMYQVPPKFNDKMQKELLAHFNLKDSPLCHDRRIFTTCLRNDEIRKHNQFTNRSMEFREEYLESILDALNPDDVRCLIITEDELNRCKPLERIFPTADTHTYLKFIEHPRYYNRLLDAWETRYAKNREEGIKLLRKYCMDNYHLCVSDAALEKEPNVGLTEIDMLHVKKTDEPIADDSSATILVKFLDDAATLDSSDSQQTTDINTSTTTTATNVINGDVISYKLNNFEDNLNDSKFNKSKQTTTPPNKVKTKSDESTGKPKTEIKIS